MLASTDDAAEEKLIAWIKAHVAPEIVSIDRQHRWRPSWYVDVRMADGSEKSLYVRGARTGSDTEGQFDMEYRIFLQLEKEGIPVPHVYGKCDDPLSIITDRAAGRADLSTADSDEERAAVLAQYVEVLARIHAIPPANFDHITMPRPQVGDHIGLVQFENYEKKYRAIKRRAEPILEFLIGWVRRNAPRNRDKISFLVCDPAQFMFDQGQLTAVLDLEMAYIGDPMHDVAALQLRDTSEPLGDLGAALRHYEKVTGKPIDAAAFDFYAIAWSVVTPVSMTDAVTKDLPTGNVLQYLEWWITFCRVPLELIAATTGRKLTPPPAIVGEPTPYRTLGRSLTGAIEAIPVPDDFATYERTATAKLAGYMERIAEFGPGITRLDMAETEALLGRRFDNWQDADAALEAFIMAAGPEEDDRLLPVLYNRAHRQCQLLAPFLSRESVGITLKTHAQLMDAWQPSEPR